MLTQLSYDLRKLKAHGLPEGQNRRYPYRLTGQRLKAALLFVLFYRRVRDPFAYNLFTEIWIPGSMNRKLEVAYRKADDSVQKIVDLLAA